MDVHQNALGLKTAFFPQLLSLSTDIDLLLTVLQCTLLAMVGKLKDFIGKAKYHNTRDHKQLILKRIMFIEFIQFSAQTQAHEQPHKCAALVVTWIPGLWGGAPKQDRQNNDPGISFQSSPLLHKNFCKRIF